MGCTPNKESLLALVKPDMHLTKGFQKRIYSFNMYHPGFSEEAIAALEAVGCVRAREHYTSWVQEYESKRDAELKEVAHWYRLEWEKRRKEGEERRKREEKELLLKRKRQPLTKEQVSQQILKW